MTPAWKSWDLAPVGVLDYAPPAHHAAPVAAALADFEAATREHGPSDEWDRRVIDAVLRHLAEQGQPFSANEARELLPVVRSCLISRRFIAAQREGWLRRVGYTPSTLPSTHGHPIGVYAPT